MPTLLQAMKMGLLGGNTAPVVHPLLTDLVSYWRLEEASGTRYDSYGTNHLTEVNTVGQVAGKVGNAASFVSGDLTRLTVAHNDSLAPTNDFGVCCWVNALSIPVSTFGGICSKGDSSANVVFRVRMNADGTFTFNVKHDATTITLTSDVIAIPPTGWHFVAAWYQFSSKTMWLQIDNGVLKERVATGTLATNTAPFVVGTYIPGSATYHLTGYIDELMYTKRIWSPADLTWLYNGGNGRTWTEVQAYTG